MKKLPPLLLGLLLLGGLARWHHETDLALISASATAHPTGRELATQTASAPLDRSHATAPRAAHRPVTASIRQVLPELDRLYDDWRAYKPATITLAAYPDTPLTFTAVSVREENGRTIWTGRNAVEGAFLVAVATADLWSAELTVPGANIFSIEITGDTATLTETHDTTAACGTCLAPPDTAPAPAQAAVETLAATPETTGPRAAEDGINTVDLVLFYHPQLLNPTGTNASTYKTRDAIENQANLHIAYLNQAALNSALPMIQWRYVALYEVPDYPHSYEDDPDQNNTLQKDLSSMANANTELGRFIAEKMVLHGGDQAVLYVPYAVNRSGSYTAGVAHQPGRNAVVSLSAGISAIFGHECAHNLGCGHDRIEAEAPDNNNRYNYGHVEQKIFRTIMAYGSNPRIPYFSNPDVTYNSLPTGRAATDPKAADNARRIREQAVSFAAFRSPPVNAPTITSHPAAIAAQTGAAFSFSVTATGTGLTYQWRKDSLPLAGATTATYGKTAALDDAGAYSVVVANAGGQVISNAATLIVTTPPPPPPPVAASTGSGGGGGGAPSHAFLATLAVLAAARCIGSRARAIQRG